MFSFVAAVHDCAPQHEPQQKQNSWADILDATMSVLGTIIVNIVMIITTLTSTVCEAVKKPRNQHHLIISGII